MHDPNIIRKLFITIFPRSFENRWMTFGLRRAKMLS